MSNLKTTGTGLKAKTTGVDVLNAIRSSMPVTYQDRIPEATKNNIKEYGNSLKNFPVIMNAFVDILVNKIGLTVIKNKSYTNPLKMFQRGDLEVGEVIEEIFVDVVKAKVYTPEAPANNLGDVFAINKPNVLARYHVVNSQLVYPITINKAELLRAFRSVAYFEEFVSKIFESVYASEELDEFLQTKELIQNYRTAPEEGGEDPVNRFYDVQVTAISDEASAKAFARIVREYSNNLMFMNNKYNYAGVTTHTPKEDQVLIVNTSIDAWLDVEVLAYAFNMAKANPEDVLGKKVVLDDFGDDTDTTTLALLVDRDWFMIYNQLYEVQEQDNALHLYYNRFLHVWKAYSTSQFANAIRFTTTVPEQTVVSVTINPQTATIPKGTSLSCTADVQVTNGADASVTWSLVGSPTSAETKISADGVLEVGTDETLTSIGVKATSVKDGTKTGTATYTIVTSVIQPASSEASK